MGFDYGCWWPLNAWNHVSSLQSKPQPDEGFDEDKASASITTLMANKIMDSYIREERERQERLSREVLRPDNLLTPKEIAEAKLMEINENRNRLVNAGKSGRLIK